MKRQVMVRQLLMVPFFILSNLSWADDVQNWNMEYKPVVGSYAIYGGGLGDPAPPTKKDKKIAFSLKGEVAKEMFDAIGPDLKDFCGAENGYRARSRDNDQLHCIKIKNEYNCYFGFDLRTGK